MREAKTVELGSDIRLEVKELTVEQILKFYDDFAKMESGSEEDDSSGAGPLAYVETLFKLSIEAEHFTFEDLKKLTPSEIKEIYNTFKDVNKVFFEVSQSLGLNNALEGLVAEAKKDFTKIFLVSSNEDTPTS